jgi:hypothetical protein
MRLLNSKTIFEDRAKSPHHATHDASVVRYSCEARIVHLSQRALLLAAAIKSTDALLAETKK